MNRSKNCFLMGAVFFACLGLDQITKRIAEAKLRYTAPLYYLFHLVKFQYAGNPGAWGSLGGGMPESARFWLLTFLPGLVMAALALYLGTRREIKTLEAAGFALILGGGVGNLIDRILYG